MQSSLFCVLLNILVITAQNSLFNVCHGDLGCFSILAPFGFTLERPLALLPQSPDTINTLFKLYTRAQPATPLDLPATQVKTSLTTIWPGFVSRPTKIIVHGFLDSVDLTSWGKQMKDELLKQGDYNVILVDWSGGNKLPYTQATANTRVVGAQIAQLINQIIAIFSTPVKDFHVIGHSLGAHTAGYAGERVPGLGRITGLDPAGPYFENTPASVRLDPTDALFVDVIHTDAGTLLTASLGIIQAVGHADFYPNSGHNQPGCIQSPVTTIEQWGLVEGLNEFLICSHMRAIRLFTESINSSCHFKSYPCASELNFVLGLCTTCGVSGCANMGFWASPTLGKFFLKTAGNSPFCLA
ncbi:inactive pancreatic lipase-related protein 1-like [Physella acuta]|uniref:inactive pancreatic lipase-related protein 1-like n=1 Tax=Physella acuta TaxID=109671 RepID=UPI0027DC9212|nr:inactive pancreatic lipase-related protein 1-like [Physella acuta]